MLAAHSFSKVQVFSRQLPPEIWIVVLSYLIDDRMSLKVCAFVCRAWLSATRPYLLETVRIHNLSTCTEIDASIDTFPDIARYVREPHVGPIEWTDSLSREEYIRDVWSCCLRLLGKLKGIRKLSIDLNSERVDLAPEDIQGQLPALLEGVETLVLKDIACLGGLAALKCILLACSRLSHLYFHQIHFADEVAPYHRYDATANHKEALRTLVWTGWAEYYPSAELLSWLRHGGMNFSPSRLGFKGMTEGTWDLVHAAGDSLEYLSVDLEYSTSRPPTAPAFACNTRLASIDIIRFNPHAHGAEGMLSVLSNIGATNTSMRQLGLSVVGSALTRMSSDASIWREVDSHLARLARSLPALVVTLYFYYCYYVDDHSGKIIELVDNLTLFREARGRLSVCWSATREQYLHAKAVDLKLMCLPDVDPGLLGSL
ncbi:hypothetical protein WOLCODRAFT_154579 [Wolfiporia cocos MD-104 SS10]|uniref:F-box domain-containing protein n=1 Tax=Wolfiporia cocos (strain MD-104) TaxID=742152 RepID=A0A2H3K061_WOLCO|nr:hypothetical protein WOLCODRAFT_154579 [Wolfiporia cocos MD-104 SS10]